MVADMSLLIVRLGCNRSPYTRLVESRATRNGTSLHQSPSRRVNRQRPSAVDSIAAGHGSGLCRLSFLLFEYSVECINEYFVIPAILKTVNEYELQEITIMV